MPPADGWMDHHSHGDDDDDANETFCSAELVHFKRRFLEGVS